MICRVSGAMVMMTDSWLYWAEMRIVTGEKNSWTESKCGQEDVVA